MAKGADYAINREPLSTHLEYLKKNGFTIELAEKQHITNIPSCKRNNLTERFINLTDDDFSTSGAFIVAVKSRH